MLNGTPVSAISPKVHSSAVTMASNGSTTARSVTKVSRYTSRVINAAQAAQQRQLAGDGAPGSLVQRQPAAQRSGQLPSVGRQNHAYPLQERVVVALHRHRVDEAQRRHLGVEQQRPLRRRDRYAVTPPGQLRGGHRRRAAGGDGSEQQPPATALEGVQVERRQTLQHLRQIAQVAIDRGHLRELRGSEQVGVADPHQQQLAGGRRVGVLVDQAPRLRVARQQLRDIGIDAQPEQEPSGQTGQQRQGRHHRHPVARHEPGKSLEHELRGHPGPVARGCRHRLPRDAAPAPRGAGMVSWRAP